MYVIYSHFKKLIPWSRKLLAEVNFHNCASNLKTGHDVGDGIFIIVSVLYLISAITVRYLTFYQKEAYYWCLWLPALKVNLKRRTLLLCFE